MLILAGVTINLVVNGGLFGQAAEAARLTDIRGAEDVLMNEILAWQIENMDTYDMTESDMRTAINQIVYNAGVLGDWGNLPFNGTRKEFTLAGETNNGNDIYDLIITMPLGVRRANVRTGSNTPTWGIEVGDLVAFTPIPTTHIVPGNLSGHRVPNTNTGTLTNQTFTTEENLEWRLMSNENGQIKLISSTPTVNTLTLRGAIRI